MGATVGNLRPGFCHAVFAASAYLGKAIIDAETFAKQGPAELQLPALLAKQFVLVSDEFGQKHPCTLQFLQKLVSLHLGFILMSTAFPRFTLPRVETTLHRRILESCCFQG